MVRSQRLWSLIGHKFVKDQVALVEYDKKYRGCFSQNKKPKDGKPVVS